MPQEVIIDEEALDMAAREGYAVRCETNGPRVLAEYASPDIMRKHLENARVIVKEYVRQLQLRRL
jgi:hypothetical protein